MNDLNALPCNVCNATGWVYAGYMGLSMAVMWYSKDGEAERLLCAKCKGRGIIPSQIQGK